MKTFDSKRLIRLTLTPIACATLLAACAYDTPSYPVVYDPPRAVIPGPVTTLSAFDRLDTNRDGFLSRGELEPVGPGPVVAGPVVGAPAEAPASAFARLDINRDGYLSRGEAGNMFSTIPGGSFDSFDMNRDGYLSMAEATPHMQYIYRGTPAAWSFESLDVNRDGFLSRAEAASLLASVNWSNGRWTWNTLPARTSSFEALDTNRDGFVSRAEGAAAMDTAAFARFDTNRDGFLSRTEAEPFMRWGVGASSDPYYGGAVYGPRY